MTPPKRLRVLLVEDDLEICRLVSEILLEAAFEPVTAASGREMDQVLQRESVDLVVLDVMLPNEDGLSICRRLRAGSKIPILMLTARGEEIDRVIGLEVGADDYVCKPFGSRELLARIRALLRRTQDMPLSPAEPMRALAFDGWRIEPVRRQLYNIQGVKVALTSGEFDLLYAFCQNPNRVLSRDQLLELTYVGLAGPIERSVDVHISRIRQKIEKDPKDPLLIKTVRLGGYIFTPSVEPVP